MKYRQSRNWLSIVPAPANEQRLRTFDSDPCWQVAELLDERRGFLGRFEDPVAAVTAAINLLDNDAMRQAMRKCAYQTQPADLRFSFQPADRNSAGRLLSA